MSFLKQIMNTKNNLWPCADLYFSTELLTSIRYTNSVETWTKQASDELLNHYKNYYASHHSNKSLNNNDGSMERHIVKQYTAIETICFTDHSEVP